jgi:NADPH-dependent curcumin reductase CurA
VGSAVGQIAKIKGCRTEDVLEGMEAAPGSIDTLYRGANSGKLVIRL